LPCVTVTEQVNPYPPERSPDQLIAEGWRLIATPPVRQVDAQHLAPPRVRVVTLSRCAIQVGVELW